MSCSASAKWPLMYNTLVQLHAAEHQQIDVMDMTTLVCWHELVMTAQKFVTGDNNAHGMAWVPFTLANLLKPFSQEK